jgi:hypothetical protein
VAIRKHNQKEKGLDKRNAQLKQHLIMDKESAKEKLAKRKAFILEIKRISAKMLPDGNNRNRDEPPMICLTQDERLIYSSYLTEQNQPQSAEVFGNWTQADTLEWLKKRKKEKKK